MGLGRRMRGRSDPSHSSRDGSTCCHGHTAGGSGTPPRDSWEIAPELSFSQYLIHNNGDVSTLALSPDGPDSLAGSADHTARLWDVATRHIIDPVMTHEDNVAVVAFSHDGRMFVTGDDKGVVRLWDRANRGQPRHQLRADGPYPCPPGLSPDDRIAVIGVAVGTIRIRAEIKLSCGTRRRARSWVIPCRIWEEPTQWPFQPRWSDFCHWRRESARLWDAANGRRLTNPTGGSERFRLPSFPTARRSCWYSMALLRSGRSRRAESRARPYSIRKEGFAAWHSAPMAGAS